MAKQKHPIIIGIDPGTVVTGFALIRVLEQELQLIDFGCIRPPPRYALSDRYVIIYDAIVDLLKTHQPEVASIETQFVYRNPQSTIKLCMVRGIIILAARKNNMEVFEYAPKKAKQAVTGHGNASKYQVQAMVQRLCNLTSLPEPEDAADALALAICHAHALQTNRKLGDLL